MNHFIERPSQLAELKPVIDKLIEQGGAVGVDTEFLREKTYYAKLCLLQLAIDEHQYCVDVLALDDLSLINSLMVAPKVVKIFHAARQDLEVLYQTLGVLPQPIFDTQLAAAFCGSDLQQGYSAMVAQRLEIELPKSQARTDWSRRPLSDEQLEYARLDVVHLAQLMQLVKGELESKQRADWYHDELTNFVANEEQFDELAENAWQRVAGGHLKLKQQYILRDLAIWRERTAQQKNIPRTWVLREDKLYDLAQSKSRSVDDLLKLGYFGRKSATQLAPQAIEVLRAVKAADTPLWRRSEPLSKAEKSICSQAMQKLGKIAEGLGIAQALLATRKDIEYLYRHRQSKRLMQGWRGDLVGKPLLEFIRQQES